MNQKINDISEIMLCGIFFLHSIFAIFACQGVVQRRLVFFACHDGAQCSRMVKRIYI